jgi:hypothetical protein
MLFFFGLIDGDGDRHILVGTSNPSIGDTEDLTGGGQSWLFCDWGEGAGEPQRLHVARLILSQLLYPVTEEAVAQYAEEVVSKMTTEKKWLLTEAEITDWLLTHRKAS